MYVCVHVCVHVCVSIQMHLLNFPVLVCGSGAAEVIVQVSIFAFSLTHSINTHTNTAETTRIISSKLKAKQPSNETQRQKIRHHHISSSSSSSRLCRLPVIHIGTAAAEMCVQRRVCRGRCAVLPHNLQNLQGKKARLRGGNRGKSSRGRGTCCVETHE